MVQLQHLCADYVKGATLWQNLRMLNGFIWAALNPVNNVAMFSMVLGIGLQIELCVGFARWSDQ